MNVDEATSLMMYVKDFERLDAARSPLEKAASAGRLAAAIRGYIEREAELGGWYSELMNGLGEAEPECQTRRSGVSDIHRLRRSAGFRSAGDFAHEVGMDGRTWAAIERDGGKLPQYLVGAVSWALGVSTSHLMGMGVVERHPSGRDLYMGRWRAHLVHEGERYGATGSLIYGDAVSHGWSDAGQRINDCQRYGHGLPLVEFYDTSADPAKFPGGQFVSRYYMSTLLGMDDPRDSLSQHTALTLDNGVPEWTLTRDECREVAAWLASARESLQPASAARGLDEKARELRGAADALRGDSGPDGHDPVGR